jgi:hypothetical protein
MQTATLKQLEGTLAHLRSEGATDATPVVFFADAETLTGNVDLEPGPGDGAFVPLNVNDSLSGGRIVLDRLSTSQPDVKPAVQVLKVLPDRMYVFGEDMASALVGPFDTREEAQAHVAFCEARGDGARHEVISSFIAARLDPASVHLQMTPDEDKALEV